LLLLCTFSDPRILQRSLSRCIPILRRFATRRVVKNGLDGWILKQFRLFWVYNRSMHNGRLPSTRRRRIKRVSKGLLALFGAGIVFTYVTNPFTSFTVVRKVYETEIKPNGQITLVQLSSPAPHTASFYKDVAWVTSGLRIVNNVYTGGKKSNNQDVEHIIDDIHNLRFDSKNPYLISGDHFSQLFPRSLGIFYASLLDPRTARSYTDWLNRQTIYLKTTAYALDVVARTQSLPTTIVPAWRDCCDDPQYLSPSFRYALQSVVWVARYDDE